MRVVITGAGGRVGGQIVEELSASHDLCLIDRSPVSGKRSVVADLAQSHRIPWIRFNEPRWRRAFEGADVIIHLAADPRPKAPWPKILHNNVQATWNVLETAARRQVPRVVFASSNWAVKALERELAPACYSPCGRKIGSDVSARPITAYGISKAFGEISGRTYVDEKKLESFVAVRIGYFKPIPPTNEKLRQRWIGAQDIRTLFRRCVEAEFKGFHVVYGVSAQPAAPYDLSHTCRLLSWTPRELP